jgi:hypothetical protein
LVKECVTGVDWAGAAWAWAGSAAIPHKKKNRDEHEQAQTNFHSSNIFGIFAPLAVAKPSRAFGRDSNGARNRGKDKNRSRRGPAEGNPHLRAENE